MLLEGWLANCSKGGMRGFLILLVTVGLTVVFLRQRQNQNQDQDQDQSQTPAAVASKPVAAQVKPAPLTPAPLGQASEHNWMKRSLDRARDVAGKSRAQSEDGQR